MSTARRAATDLPTVLVVEDEAEVARFIRTALEGVAMPIDAPDGASAAAVLDTQAARDLDLVLVDHVIPEPSGLDIVRLVAHRWPWIPTVIMTGFGSETLVVDALRAGARDYLRKPLQIEELRRTVRRLTRPGPPAMPPAEAAPASTPAPAPARPGAGRALHRGVRQALEFVSAHFAEDLTLGQVAHEASLTKFHFCRLFHQETGRSLKEHLQVVRVGRAAALLADPRLTVTEIAYAVGFNDLSHFDKVFRRIAGVPPSEYRKALRSA